MAITSIDPKKLQQQSTLVKPPEPLKPVVQPVAQTKTQIAPVQSSLPPMQQTQTAPATVSQAAAAKRDPRFAQAISSKYQKELEQRKQQLGQQQAQYEQRIKEAGFKGDTSEIEGLLGAITTGTSPAEVQAAEQRYQALMRAQAGSVEDPEEYRRAQAKLAALGRLSGAGIAKMYGTSTAGVVAPETFYSISSPELEQKRQIGKLALREAEQKNVITEALKEQNVRQAEAIRQMSGEQLGAKQRTFLSDLEQKGSADVAKKESALNRLKEAMFLGKYLSDEEISSIGSTLGLDPNQIQNLGSLDISQIEGMMRYAGTDETGNIRNLGGNLSSIQTNTLDEIANRMRNESDRLTDEQKRFLSYYDAIKGLGRQSDISGALAYATPEQKANINALRRLRGETELSEEELKQLGKGAESGKIKDVSSLIKSFEEEEKRSASYKSIEQDALNFDKMKRQDYYKNISSLTDFAYKLKRSADPNITQGGSSLLSAIEQLKSSSQREGGKVTATEAGLASVAPILLPIFASTGGKSVDNEKIYDANDAISRILGSLPDYIKKTGSVLKRGLRKK